MLGGMEMFKRIIEKLTKTQEEMDEILQRIITQNEDMEDLSEELLGERLSDEIMSQVIEETGHPQIADERRDLENHSIDAQPSL